MQRGIFLVLEGADGSGKTTQFNLLAERLQAVGYEVAVFDFPRYGEPSSHFIQSYLNGEYGPASQVSPYTASLFYALDRYETKASIAEALNAGKIVLSNRYVGSNMAHQGSKFTNLAERRGFFIWEDGLEFELLGIPRPSLNIFLRVPAETSYELIGRKDARSYTDKKHDEHEGDINHLRQTVETYEQLCKLFPKDFKLIECTKNKKMLSVPLINNLIWDTIKPLLPSPINKPQSRMVTLDKPSEMKQQAVQKIVSSGAVSSEEQLKVNIKGISLLDARRILKHLAISGDEKTPKRITAQSLLVPETLTSKLVASFKQGQNMLLANYQKMAKQVGPEIARAVLPLSCLADIHVNGGAPDWLKLITDLNEYSSLEVRKINSSLGEQLNKRWPDPFKNLTSLPTAKFKPPQDSLDIAVGQTNDLTPVSLAGVFPRNEIDILSDTIYSNSDMSRDEIAAALDGQTYQQKSDTLLRYLKTNSIERETLLDKISYEVDLVTSGVALDSLLALNVFNDIQIQPATPRFGYDVPEEIEDAGLSDLYLECFDLSLRKYSELQATGLEYEAQYAVLLGHKVRWHGTLSARDFLQLISFSAGKSAEHSAIVKELSEKILEAHPNIGLNLVQMANPTPQSTRRKSNKSNRRKQKK